MRIVLVTDAWYPQVNGVVRTYTQVIRELTAKGHKIEVIFPERVGAYTINCPSYPQIKLALMPFRKLSKTLESIDFDCIHIATEGPLGLAARRYCIEKNFKFTTSYHTSFPEYIEMRYQVPRFVLYKMLRWFHSAAAKTLVSTNSIRTQLARHGFENLAAWSRGVDTDLFHPNLRKKENEEPVFLYVGRVAVEKNISAFLDLKLPGKKVIVGDGPQLTELKQQYGKNANKVQFLGKRFGAELASIFAAADVFIFPSKTDTFGLVMLEALASGTPVAAFPVSGPIDVIRSEKVGILSEDLGEAAIRALNLSRSDCRKYAENFSWADCARRFTTNLVPHHLGRASQTHIIGCQNGAGSSRRFFNRLTASISQGRLVI